MEGRREARIGLIVTGGDAAELLQALEAIFNQVPPLVHFDIVGNERLSIGLRRDNGECTSLVQFGADDVIVERLIGEERCEFDVCHQRLHADAVMTLARKKDEAHQVAQRINERHDLGGQAAARFADGLILSPPFAPVPC